MLENGMMNISPTVSPGAADLGAFLAAVGPSNAEDLALLRRHNVNMVHQWLVHLERAGLVERAELGWTRRLSGLWWLTDAGVSRFRAVRGAWHFEAGRCRLLEILPCAEQFYRVAGELQGLGEFREFCWLDDVGIDAAARYESGWITLAWSGAFQAENDLVRRMEGLGEQIAHMSVSAPAWPSLFCYVVSDAWQGQLVQRAARACGLEDRVAIWCVSDGSRSGVLEPLHGRGWIFPHSRGRRVGTWRWDRRLEQLPWSRVSRLNSLWLGPLVDCLAEWSGLTMKVARRSLGEDDRGRKADKAMNLLRRAGLVDAMRDRDKGPVRYGFSGRGIDVLCRRDGVAYKKEHVLKEVLDRETGVRQHQDGLMDLMGQFMLGGFETAAGWRSWEHMGSKGALKPDGMVYVQCGPYGRGWYYVEYERRAHGRQRVETKLRGYLSKARQDRFPVMVVSRDDAAERHFQQVGREGDGLDLVTTNEKRLKEHGALGNTKCWRMYDQEVLIGPP